MSAVTHVPQLRVDKPGGNALAPTPSSMYNKSTPKLPVEPHQVHIQILAPSSHQSVTTAGPPLTFLLPILNLHPPPKELPSRCAIATPTLSSR